MLTKSFDIPRNRPSEAKKNGAMTALQILCWFARTLGSYWDGLLGLEEAPSGCRPKLHRAVYLPIGKLTIPSGRQLNLCFHSMVRIWKISSMIQPKRSESRGQMFGFLFHHEFIAMAIRNHAMAEQVYQYWREANIAECPGQRFRAYVHSRRKKSRQENLYSELEWTAQKWTGSSS